MQEFLWTYVPLQLFCALVAWLAGYNFDTRGATAAFLVLYPVIIAWIVSW